MKVAIVRGAFSGPWELQNYYTLKEKDVFLKVFTSQWPLDSHFELPQQHLWSPVDLPSFPYKMPILNRLIGDAHYLWGLEKQLYNFDIAHTAETYYYYTQQCLKAKKRGWVKKVISTVWETIPFNNEQIWRRRAFKYRASQEIDLFLAPTQRAARALKKEGVATHKIKVLPMGVGQVFFTQKIKPQRKIATHLLFVGRLVKEKGIWDLLQSFKRLQKDGLKLKLLLVGQGPERKRITAWIKANGFSRFVKIKKVEYRRMPKVYRWADIFILPSIHTRYWEEQYGMAAVEALASGLPVVVSDSGALPEVVGPAGIVVPESNPSILAKTLYQLATDSQRRNDLGVLAYQWARKRYFAPTVAAKILDIYTTLLRE